MQASPPLDASSPCAEDRMARWLPVGKGLGVGLLAVGLATALTALLWPRAQQAPFSLFYVALLVATVFGNAWSGTLTGLLSITVTNLLFLAPRGSHPAGRRQPRDDGAVCRVRKLGRVPDVAPATGSAISLIGRSRESSSAAVR